MKAKFQHIDIEIDKLTNSIENSISGDTFPTDVLLVESADLKKITKKNGWLFNWQAELKLADRDVYVSFTAKTKLIHHYEKTLGAVNVGGHLMIINTEAALKLIDKYFKN